MSKEAVATVSVEGDEIVVRIRGILPLRSPHESTRVKPNIVVTEADLEAARNALRRRGIKLRKA